MKRHIFIMILLVILFGIVITPAAAQIDDGETLINTITVTGSGSAQGTPDIAILTFGVEMADPDVAAAFQNANTSMANVIAMLVEAGVAREDIQTTGFNVWQEVPGSGGPPPFLAPAATPIPLTEAERQIIYHVNNQVTIRIRDITLVADAIQAGIAAGANNLYGLNFAIDDRTALEQEARAAAMNDAQTRAAQYAELIGAELGDAIIVTEGIGGYYPSPAAFGGEVFLSGIGAPIEPGQSSVSIQVQVVYRINR